MGGIRVHSELAEGIYRFFQEDNDYRLFVEKATERQWGSRHLTFRKGSAAKQRHSLQAHD